MAMGTAKSVWSGHSCPLPLKLVLNLKLLLEVICEKDSSSTRAPPPAALETRECGDRRRLCPSSRQVTFSRGRA